MATVRNVANYFLTLSQPEEGDQISNLKLQKLVYYAQGFHLALYGKPLFNDGIKAWDHGPVVPQLWHDYKDYGAGGIDPPADFDSSVLTEQEQSLLDEVWDTYGQFSAWKLRNMTHEEPPWKDTASGEEITHDAMTRYFLTLV